MVGQYIGALFKKTTTGQFGQLWSAHVIRDFYEDEVKNRSLYLILILQPCLSMRPRWGAVLPVFTQRMFGQHTLWGMISILGWGVRMGCYQYLVGEATTAVRQGCVHEPSTPRAAPPKTDLAGCH